MKPWQRLLLSWSREKAWALGILYGDGNVYGNYETGDYRVSASGSLSTTTRFGELFGVARAPHVVSEEGWEVYLNDKELVEHCRDVLGLFGPKADILTWPKDLPHEFERDFIRGLWDSDGSIFIESRRHRDGRGNDTPRTKYDSASQGFVASLRERIETLTGAPRVAISKQTKLNKETGRTSTWYGFKYGGASAMMVADYLYADPPSDLVNQDRVAMYAQMRELRDFVDNQACPCGDPALWEGRCIPCWYDVKGRKTGPGVTCRLCTKPVHANGLCSGHNSTEHRKLKGYVRRSSGPCACGKAAFRKGMCDACYSHSVRAAKKLSA